MAPSTGGRMMGPGAHRPGRNQPADIPAHHLGLERALLGAVLNPDDGPAALVALRSRVTATTFWADKNRMIYSRMLALDDAGRLVTTPTLALALRDAGELDVIGGESYLGLLVLDGCIAAHVVGHAEELVELVIKREAEAGARALAEHTRNGCALAALAAEARALAERMEPDYRDAALEPEVVRIGDEFVVGWPARGVQLEFDAIRVGSEGVRADVAVRLRGRELDWGTLALGNTSARVSRAGKLAKAAGGLPWIEMLDRACAVVARTIRAGEPAMPLVPRARDRAAYLIEPLLPFGQPAVIHADGGSGKSLVAVALGLAAFSGVALPGLSAAAREVRALYLDWETDEDTVASRAYLIANGLDVTGDGAIIYRRMTVPLIEAAAALRRDVRVFGIGFVIVDSLQYAVAGAGERGDVSAPYTQLFTALRTLGDGISSLVLAHHSHAGDDKREAHPYGSRFIHNACRTRWELRADREEPTDTRPAALLLGLYHRKSNDDGPRPSLALRVVFDASAIRFEPADVRASPNLLKRAPLRQRIAATMTTAALDTNTITERMNEEGIEAVSNANVRRTLERYAGQDWVRLPNTKPILWGLTTYARG